MSDAPKLEWTGERYLPWVKNATISYEHLHRYSFAARFAKDKHVLDLGSGEGYGANILARTAASVVGVDIDEKSVGHASSVYRGKNLKFLVGSFAKVPIRKDHSFDLIVCFEAIEHVENHDELLTEVKRLLAPDGLFIVSTPNKSAYHEESDEDNPFHVKELEPEEFEQLLKRYFRASTFLGQRIHSGSSIWPMEHDKTNLIEEVTVEHGTAEFEFISNEKRVPVYIIALASDSDSARDAIGSVLIDSSNELLNESAHTVTQLLETKESNETALAWHANNAKELKATIAAMQEGLDWRTSEIRGLHESIDGLQQALDWRNATITSLQEGINSRTNEVQILNTSVASLQQALDSRANEVQKLNMAIASLQQGLNSRGDEVQILNASVASLQQALGSRGDEVETLNASVASLQQALGSRGNEVEILNASVASLQQGLDWRTNEAQQLNASITALQGALDWRNATIASLQQGLDWRANEVQTLNATITSLQQGLDWRAHEAEILQGTIASLRISKAELDAIYASREWRVLKRVLPPGSIRHRLLLRLMTFLAPDPK